MSTYLKLSHGRENPYMDMDDWGTMGPTFGPLEIVRGVYDAHLIIVTEIPNEKGVTDFFFEIREGTVYYNGVYYGDWAVFHTHPEIQEDALEYPDETKLVPPDKLKPTELVGLLEGAVNDVTQIYHDSLREVWEKQKPLLVDKITQISRQLSKEAKRNIIIARYASFTTRFAIHFSFGSLYYARLPINPPLSSQTLIVYHDLNFLLTYLDRFDSVIEKEFKIKMIYNDEQVS